MKSKTFLGIMALQEAAPKAASALYEIVKSLDRQIVRVRSRTPHLPHTRILIGGIGPEYPRRWMCVISIRIEMTGMCSSSGHRETSTHGRAELRIGEDGQLGRLSAGSSKWVAVEPESVVTEMLTIWMEHLKNPYRYNPGDVETEKE